MLASNTNMTVEGRPPTDFDGNSSSDDDDDMDDDDGAYVVVLDISLGAALAAAQAGVYQSTLRLDDDFAPPTLGSTVPALPYLRHLQFDVSDSTFGYNPSDGTLPMPRATEQRHGCLLYTSDAADEEDSVDLGGRRIIKKKKQSTTMAKRET
eukprot:TRINITY_DN25688_c0_g1_i1.p1 TRINITY_DN25688_c0_g1~~TRINITY_DN25688_c0_g1_i1.p1  ORF type:complete len:152 (+),score=47.76 TRINITY_DN25688_c0_g1_i1:434-889(+)